MNPLPIPRRITRKLLAIAFAILIVMAAPVTVAPGLAETETDPADAFDDGVSGAAGQIDGLVGYSVPESVVTYDGDPGYFVTYDTDDDLDSIEEWADGHDDREILEYDNASDRVLLTAPPVAVHGGFGFVDASIGSVEFSRPTVADGLASRPYVETIDVNQRVELVEPVPALINESGHRTPTSSVLVPGRWDPEGVAFSEDANRTNLSTARGLIGRDNVSGTGEGITVALIDTGANVGDGEIYGNGTGGSSIRITAAKNFVTDEAVNVSASNPDWEAIQDGNGHGSWVASAAAANVSGTTHDGVAPDADLVIAKALDDEGSGDTQDIAEAIDWAEANGADVIVMSLGSPTYSPTLVTELDEAIEGNVSVATIAAGNSRMTTRYISSPADAPVDGVVAVAATNAPDDTNATESAYFSSVGPDPARDLSNGVTAGEGPDVAAPGMTVVAPTLTKTNGLRQNVSLSGTSMATPIVGGGYAVVLEERSEWRNTTKAAAWTENTSRRLPRAGTTEVGDGLLAVDHLVDGETVDESQADERNDEAAARDAANEGFGGNPFVRTGADLSSQIRGIFGVGS